MQWSRESIGHCRPGREGRDMKRDIGGGAGGCTEDAIDVIQQQRREVRQRVKGGRRGGSWM